MAATPDDRFSYHADEEILKAQAQMRVADPEVNNGAFTSITREDAIKYLSLIGAKHLEHKQASDDELLRRLKLALWDSQRLDNAFPGKTFDASAHSADDAVGSNGISPKGRLSIHALPEWPKWRSKHPELNNTMLGARKMDGYRDAKRLDSYVFRHFAMSAFTQTENMTGAALNADPSIAGAWLGAKMALQNVATDITRDGTDSIAVTYVPDPTCSAMLVMEILDVKEAAWPEPTKKFMELLQDMQEAKFGCNPKSPLVPMAGTPKMPIIFIRYSYMEGRPKFTLHLEKKIKEEMPHLNKKQLRAKLQWYLQSGNTASEAHIRFVAHILDFNSTLVNPSYVDELQSHWSGVSRDVIKETKIGFFTPCLRLRWKVLQEVETGLAPPVATSQCKHCGKEAGKLMCASCRSIHYDSPECSTADWPKHKDDCMLSKRILELPSDNKLYVPARNYQVFALDSGFSLFQEETKYSGCTISGEAARNDYGDARFQVVTIRPPTYSYGEKELDDVYRGSVVFMWDRRHSVQLRIGPGENAVARRSGSQFNIPFHAEGYKKYMYVLKNKGFHGQRIYLWARRVGDCLELDLRDIPDQKKTTWAND